MWSKKGQNEACICVAFCVAFLRGILETGVKSGPLFRVFLVLYFRCITKKCPYCDTPRQECHASLPRLTPMKLSQLRAERGLSWHSTSVVSYISKIIYIYIYRKTLLKQECHAPLFGTLRYRGFFRLPRGDGGGFGKFRRWFIFTVMKRKTKKRTGKQMPKGMKEVNGILVYEEINQGKPRDMPLADYIKSVLNICDKKGVAFGDKILKVQATKAAQGDSKAAEFLFDRAYGKPVQNVAMSSSTPVVNIEHAVIGLEDAKIVNE